MPLLTAKQITNKLLAMTYVRGEYRDIPASDAFWAITGQYLQGTPIELDFPQLFRDPPVILIIPGVPLRRVLEDICKLCGIRMEVTDVGSIRLSLPEKRTDDMKHRIVIEPDSQTWQKVIGNN